MTIIKNKTIIPFDFQQKLLGTTHKWLGQNKTHRENDVF